MPKPTLLIIEDDPALNQMLSLHFEDQGFGVFSAEQCAAGLQIAGSERVDVILLDQQLPDGEGIALLPRLIEVQPAAGIIMMTGQHDLELAIQAIKSGATDFIHKPIKIDELQIVVERVLANAALVRLLVHRCRRLLRRAGVQQVPAPASAGECVS